MISCEMGQMNSGGQSTGTHGITHSRDVDFKESSSDEIAENLGQPTKTTKNSHVDGDADDYEWNWKKTV